MRIGINLLYLLPGQVGGTEAYADGLLRGLARCDSDDEFHVFVNREAAAWPLPPAANVHRIVCPVNAAGRTGRYIYEQLVLPNLLNRCKIDLVHSLGYVSPLGARCPTVVTIHDLNYRAFGAQMPVVKRTMLALFVKASALRATRVITDSEFAAREITGAFGLGTDRVTVAHAAPRFHTTAGGNAPELFSRLAIHPPYFVAFSSFSPNKNIPRLLQAFALVREREHVAHQLVLVGHRPELPETGAVAHDVVFTGYLSEADLDTVLTAATCLVFPSIYEGFGLPVLDAMAVGIPVVCSRAASLPEVAGDAALYFDPYSPEDIAARMSQVVSDPDLRDRLRHAGFENVKRFSWQKTARETLRVYREILV